MGLFFDLLPLVDDAKRLAEIAHIESLTAYRASMKWSTSLCGTQPSLVFGLPSGITTLHFRGGHGPRLRVKAPPTVGRDRRLAAVMPNIAIRSRGVRRSGDPLTCPSWTALGPHCSNCAPELPFWFALERCLLSGQAMQKLFVPPKVKSASSGIGCKEAMNA